METDPLVEKEKTTIYLEANESITSVLMLDNCESDTEGFLPSSNSVQHAH